MKTSDHKMNVPFKTLAGLFALALFMACSKTEDAQTTSTNAPAVQATPAAAPTAVPTPAVEATPAAAAALAVGVVRYEALPTGSKTKMEGKSSLHPWSMETKIVSGFIEADEKFPESALTDAKATKPSVTANMPVRTFKSGTKKMDDVMLDSMNATAHSKIEYKLIELKPKSPAGTTGAIQFEATGALTISGVTRTNTMPVTIEKMDGKLKINGTTPIKMSDYSVKVKAGLVGMVLTVEDDLKITYEWMLAPKAK